MGLKCKDVDRQYEKNNNSELDNGVYNKFVGESENAQGLDDSDDSLETENQSTNNEMAYSAFQNIEVDPSLIETVQTNIGTVYIYIYLEEDILGEVEKLGFPREYTRKCLQDNDRNYATATYYLIDNNP